ncbi:MAG: hypothetical protein NkDv07_0760 [Candidatus Improbicoccus devescovinae]|nr:MAG: hypothetical protein NkDv07_0760 [Candidatus Improbicoccus devescovinae]
MNNFFKNNKIIMCILFISILTSPAHAAIAPWAPYTIQQLNLPPAVTAEVDKIGYELRNTRIPAGEGTRMLHRGLNRLRNAQLGLDEGNPINLLWFIMETGVLFIPDSDSDSYIVLILLSQFKIYVGRCKSLLNNWLRTMRAPIIPYIELIPAIKIGAPGLFQWYLKKRRPVVGRRFSNPWSFPSRVADDVISREEHSQSELMQTGAQTDEYRGQEYLPGDQQVQRKTHPNTRTEPNELQTTQGAPEYNDSLDLYFWGLDPDLD